MKPKRLRPLDKPRPPQIGIKLLILAALLFLAYISPEIVKMTHVYTKADKTPKRKISFQIPKKIDWGKLINFKELETRSLEFRDEFQQEVLGKTDKIISKTASDAASAVSTRVSKTIFDTTIKPIVKQFEKLPPDQQKRTKELICK